MKFQNASRQKIRAAQRVAECDGHVKNVCIFESHPFLRSRYICFNAADARWPMARLKIAPATDVACERVLDRSPWRRLIAYDCQAFTC